MNEKAPTSSDPALTMKHEQAAGYLTTQLEQGQMLANRIVQTEGDLNIYRQDVETWNDYNEDLLRRMLSSTDEANRYAEYTGEFMILPGYETLREEYNLQEEFKYLKGDVHTKVDRLQSLLERLTSFPALDTQEGFG